MSEPQGRARGRARGRSRGQPPQSEGTRRPGQEAAQGPPGIQRPAAGVAPPPAAAAAAAAAPAAPASGRASHRGGSRADSKPGDPSLAEQLARLQVGGGDDGNGRRVAGRGASRGRPEEFEPATRPSHIVDKKGSSGNPIRLKANYFAVQSLPNWSVYQYHVNYDPDIESLALRKGMMNDHRQLLGNVFIFDGMALWAPRKLEQEVTEVYSQRRSDGTNVRVTIKFIKELNPNDPVMLQICNIQMRKNFNHMNFQLLGRNYFDMHDAAAIPRHKLELWPGYVTSIRQHENQVLMCTDLSFKVLRQDTVLDMLYELYQKNERTFRDEAAKKLLGNIILTRYNNRTYRIDDIDWDKNPSSTFKLRNGTDISYVEYYKTHWNTVIKDATQPLLVSRPKKSDIRRGMTEPIILVPEVCTMTGIDDETRSDFMVMKDLAAHTRVDPDKRVQNLLRFLGRIQQTAAIKEEMGNWGMEYGQNLVELQGRVLQVEKISQCGNSYEYNPKSADWSREMRGQRLQSCVNLENWVLVCTQRDSSKGDDFLQNLSRVGPPMGIQVRRPRIVAIGDDKTNTFINAIREILDAKLQLVVVIVPNNRKDRYDAIKKLCCLDFPVASQVIVGRTLQKKQMLMSVATKIAIQLNCKLGGEVWCLEVPLKNLMVVGYDSYHDSSQKGRSVGGVVCSLNPTLTRYHSRVTFQTTQQEMLDAFSTNFTSALKRYYELNNTLPERIVFFRDGVGDGQLPKVVEWELPQIQQCFRNMGPSYQPKFAFVVVTKRLNTRFFARAGNQHDNPPPGTVVDTEVTRPERYDFFLVSQSVRQGTVAPTQYNVIHDTSTLKPDHIQRLTYKLTHLYYNWPGTIRVPAPCQYAHKLAFLVGQSLHKDPHLDLADTLYYL